MLHATQPEWWQRLVRLLRRQIVAVTMALSGAGLFALMGIVAVGRPDGDLHVWFLEMGHSNAVLIQTPGGAQILVDGGRYPSRLLTAIGDRVPFTDRRIELLIITHPDEFDISALTAVVERYDIGAVLTNGQPNQGTVFTRLQDALAETPTVAAVAGYTVELDDGVLIEVLHPAEQPTLSDDIGDNALVLRVSYGDVSFLLTSDLGVAGQRALIDNGAWPLASVLQLPDHATARSLDDDFLDAVQPQAFVVLVDPANRRGDPDPDVLGLLDAQTPLFRTDQGGWCTSGLMVNVC